MIDVIIADEYIEFVTADAVVNAVQAALSHQGVSGEIEMTVLIEGDERIRELNSQFMGQDRPTDVLSFPADERNPETGLRYLGDIIISYPTAETQAIQANVPVQDEIQLLAIHGTLHLLGHDHADPAEKWRMWQAQAEVLAQLGIAIHQLPE